MHIPRYFGIYMAACFRIPIIEAITSKGGFFASDGCIYRTGMLLNILKPLICCISFDAACHNRFYNRMVNAAECVGPYLI